LGAFGPGRLMFASNWPFCLEATDAWKKVLATFTQALGAQTMEVRAKILGETAARVYRLA
jgi:L-fuconolactonase